MVMGDPLPLSFVEEGVFCELVAFVEPKYANIVAKYKSGEDVMFWEIGGIFKGNQQKVAIRHWQIFFFC